MTTVRCLTILFTLSLLCPPTHGNYGVNGGHNCAECVVLISLIEQMAEIHNATITRTLQILCSYLPAKFEDACDEAFEFLEPLLVELLIQRAGPDVACHALKFCKTEPGQKTCQSLTPSFQLKHGLPFKEHVLKAQQSISLLLQKRPLPRKFCDLPGIKTVCQWVQKFTKSHEPLVDIDGDRFSITETVRGAFWRGKDCFDLSADFHPGALPDDGDRKFDSNCNGIFGVNKKTKRSYEDELCGLSQARGVAVLGDSISAHFHLPSQWIDATQISKKAFLHADMIVANELDWPMMSSVTGYGTNIWPEAINGSVDSIYLRLRERNHCNHRDYQNIGVNGEDSSSEKLNVHLLSRSASKDKPLIVFYALVGNDVCNHHQDTFAHMTTPAEFYNNTLNTLETLHQMLPSGSHVILVGLADGRVLYESIAERIHPLGTYWGMFTYAKYYDFLNCLQISPCRGWMNSNKTMRDLTTERANELSEVLLEIANQRRDSYSNFKLYYLDDPFSAVLDLWRKQGRQGWELIEASDGFHANQLANALIAQVLWDKIISDYPEVVGPRNPNNDLIKKLFGDQGGY